MKTSSDMAAQRQKHPTPLLSGALWPDGGVVFSYNYSDVLFGRMVGGIQTHVIVPVAPSLDMFGFTGVGETRLADKSSVSVKDGCARFSVVWQEGGRFGAASGSFDDSGVFTLATRRQDIVAAVMLALAKMTDGKLRIRASTALLGAAVTAANTPAANDVSSEVPTPRIRVVDPVQAFRASESRIHGFADSKKSVPVEAPLPPQFIEPERLPRPVRRDPDTRERSTPETEPSDGFVFSKQQSALLVGLPLLVAFAAVSIGLFVGRDGFFGLPQIAAESVFSKIEMPAVGVGAGFVDDELFVPSVAAIPKKYRLPVSKPDVSPPSHARVVAKAPKRQPVKPEVAEPPATARLAVISADAPSVFGVPVVARAVVERTADKAVIVPSSAAVDYQIVSIPTSEMVLVSTKDGQVTRITPYAIGSKLPDGRTITATDVRGGLVMTDRGPVSVGG